MPTQGHAALAGLPWMAVSCLQATRLRCCLNMPRARACASQAPRPECRAVHHAARPPGLTHARRCLVPRTHASLPAVIAQNGASVRLLPLLLATEANRPAATVVRFLFNATVPATGLSCAGFVDVCARRLARNGVPARNAPACPSFQATKAVRDLTTCSA